MRYTFLIIILLVSCSKPIKPVTFNSVTLNDIYTDSLSIRAIELMGNSLAFAANRGTFGTVDLGTGKVRANVEKHHTTIPEFRAITHTSTDFFMLSVETPALLYKTGKNGRMELVYTEEGEGVFYDAMTFWNDTDGIAVGDTVEGCLSIIITEDGGTTWSKLPCSQLPEGIESEGAFAASNTNIKTVGTEVWIATTSGRIYHSSDKGKQWDDYQTPLRSAEPTEGIYSIDFNDNLIGVAIGGDYTKPDNAVANKAITKDGGKTWQLLSDGNQPGYKSCIQFVPGTNGYGLVAVGFTGISYSADMGLNWKELSKESFYTLRFQNDSVAYAAGKNRISKLIFK
ncbi:WD40/YVTN/BNR-like repeat-containing protein [Maribacter sp. ACAM166]|uniref:WD40/YVTN/BNR-like repeat-containing protein n=1 Tax=Maribacter sp. ACAM166 TaxID=2508996 RepID=UPI0010FDC8F7|nr:oxidoreductase [Maribacter sp. ACAM166]TLP79095.1 oxidoreductase [Maribacter sp. ACAM166]